METLTFKQNIIVSLLLDRFDAIDKLMAIRYIKSNFRSRYEIKDIIIAYNRAYCNE